MLQDLRVESQKFAIRKFRYGVLGLGFRVYRASGSRCRVLHSKGQAFELEVSERLKVYTAAFTGHFKMV